MITVCVDPSAAKNQEVWRQLKRYGVEPSDLGRCHFLVLMDEDSGESRVSPFHALEEVDGDLRTARAVILNLRPSVGEVEQITERLCELRSEFFIHNGDKEWAKDVEKLLHASGISAAYYRHLATDQNWQTAKQKLGLVFKLSLREVFHDISGRTGLLKTALKLYDADTPLSLWDSFHEAVMTGGHDINKWFEDFLDQLTALIDMSEVQEILGEKFTEFESLSGQIYKLATSLFPNERPRDIPQERVKELAEALEAWKSMAKGARGNN